MRILLAQNSLYYPAHGGGDKSNRLLIEALAARGHDCRVVARISTFGDAQQRRYLEELATRGVTAEVHQGIASFCRNQVHVDVVTNANPRDWFSHQVATFQPEVILASTDDPAQFLLEVALDAPAARVIYLARATLALPFGPDCAFPSQAKTERLRRVDAMVGVSQYVADYARQYGGIPAVHVPISLMEPEAWPVLGRQQNRFVTFVNPCAVKGIAIFLALADAFPQLEFAAVPTWGTNPQDRAALDARRNITVLDPVDRIDALLEQTSVLLVPSLWAEARSRIVLEAMLRGVPVIASDVGGIPEAKMGVPYLLPVRPITRYRPALDEQMVPIAEVPEQDIQPWHAALHRLTSDPAHYAQIAAASLQAARNYARTLTVEPFEQILIHTPRSREIQTAQASKPAPLSPEKRQLLGLLLRKKAPASSWFPNFQNAAPPYLFCFPHAGGGATAFRGWDLPNLVAVRLPGRESRIAETPFERMESLIPALADAIHDYLAQPFAFFGHSMGGAIAFELTRELRRRGGPQPRLLIASGTRAPQYRKGHVPGPDPTDEELAGQLRSLQETPAEWLDDRTVWSVVLPSLRADTTLYRRYTYLDQPPLHCGIRAYGGLDDPNVKLEHLQAWAQQTVASFRVRQFPGGHFYLRPVQAEFLAALAEDLE